MFHSYFNEYAFDDINIYLLTSSCTLHRRKFRTNVSVHICTVSYTHLTLPTNSRV